MSEPTPWSAALAPAKVNLWLRVLGRRADDFHELDTALLALDWCDRVRARARPDTGSAAGAPSIRLVLGGPALSADVPADATNLAWRAAAEVLEEALATGTVAPGTGLELELEKHVPSRAGLGGGSSDAVAAALAARAALGLAPRWPGLVPLARRLGSDTAFFAEAEGGCARCTGRGERVAPLPAPSGLVVAVVTPALEASTAAVYGALDSGLPGPDPVPTVGPDLLALPVDSLRARLVNDLEPAALAAVPGLACWRDVLDRAGAEHFLLSGSGSSFCGLFEDVDSASRCLSELTDLARVRGLAWRAVRVAAPAGHGARLDGSRA